MPRLLPVLSRSALCLLLTAALLAPDALAQDRPTSRRTGPADRAVPSALRAEVDAAVAEAGTAPGSGLAEAVTAALTQEAKLTASDDTANDNLGYSVALSGDRALVGAYGDDDGGSFSGAAYVFAFNGSTWSQERKLTASDAATGDQFGYSVALSGDRALVGAYFDDCAAGDNCGAAYVFAFDGTAWSQQAKLTASDAATGDQFGYSVALSGDRALVGAYFDDDGGSASGAAYVFAFTGSTWSQERKLTASDAATGDFFGYSVALSGDRALVGAYGDGSASGAAYVFVFDGTAWSQQAKLTASDAATGDQFGISVALSGDRALVGAHWDDDGGSASGAAYVFAFTGSTWSQERKLTASDAAAGDYFGYSVALSGDRALVGAYFDDDGGSASGSFSGAAYVFAFDGTAWSQQAKLTASDAATGDRFGISVALSGDRALVGAYFDDDGGSASGAAYVFAFDGTAWSQQAKLTASDAATGDQFGISVALSGDRALVGAHWDDDGGSNSGAAYVFAFDGTAWSQQQKLTASDAATGDQFGYSVALSGDRALVGAHWDGSASGAAYVFVFDGTAWSQQQKLTASDAATGDFFGYSVALSGDRALVGAYFDDDGGSASGSAYVFAFDGTAWSQQQKLTASDAATSDRFGYSVALSGDRALVGADGDDDGGSFSGAAYVFVFTGSTWSQEQKLTASDAATGDQFGYSVALSGDRALVGAHWDDDGGSASGAAYVFVFTGSTWSQEQKLTASDAATGDFFGYSVALSGDRALVGAHWDDDGGSASGAAYVFVFTGSTWSQEQKLTASDAATGDFFGYSVALSGDRALVGAYGDGSDSGSFSGAAYVFAFDGPLTITVDSAFDDDPDTNADGICAGPSFGECQLRSALNEANAQPDPREATIAFDIVAGPPGSQVAPGVWRTTLAYDGPDSDSDPDPLPLITQPRLTIDGLTQPGASCGDLVAGTKHDLRVILDGSALSASNGLELYPTVYGVTIRGLVVQNAPGYGIWAEGIDTLVECNHLGTDYTGETAAGNDRGLLIRGTAQNNLASGNTQIGILDYPAPSAPSAVQRNLVGTDADGDQPLGNGIAGIWISGDDTVVSENVVSANGFNGIYLGVDPIGNSLIAEGAVVTDNTVGLTRLRDVGPGGMSNRVGISVSDGASDNDIGLPGQGNVVGGNVNPFGNGVGIIVYDAGSDGNRIRGNTVGLTQGGTAAPNNSGIYVGNAVAGTVIGGAAPGEGNVVAGNTLNGITLSGDTDTRVEGNTVGLNAAGEARPNGQVGDGLQNSGVSVAGSTNPVILGNTLSGNNGSGLRFEALGQRSALDQRPALGQRSALEQFSHQGGFGR